MSTILDLVDQLTFNMIHLLHCSHIFCISTFLLFILQFVIKSEASSKVLKVKVC